MYINLGVGIYVTVVLVFEGVLAFRARQGLMTHLRRELYHVLFYASQTLIVALLGLLAGPEAFLFILAVPLGILALAYAVWEVVVRVVHKRSLLQFYAAQDEMAQERRRQREAERASAQLRPDAGA